MFLFRLQTSKYKSTVELKVRREAQALLGAGEQNALRRDLVHIPVGICPTLGGRAE